jgi:hypothetical protein
MAVIEGGTTASLAEVGAAAAKGLHVTVKPHDAGSLGHYRYAGFTGVIPAAFGANSEVFQFRWTDATRLCLIERVYVTASVSTTAFAAGVPVQIDMVKATSWTVAGTLGTAISPAALLKRRTSFGSSLVASGDMRIATTAALGAGTKTLETLSIGALTGQPGTAVTRFIADTLLEYDPGDYMLTLATNEGFVIRSVAVPGTGTWQMSVTVDWIEVGAY